MKEETLELLDKANTALFEAEQAIRLEEKAQVNGPMYRLRCGLGEVIQRYKTGLPVCNWATTIELVGRMR